MKSFLKLDASNITATFKEKKITVTSWITPDGIRSQDHTEAKRFGGCSDDSLSNIPNFMSSFFPEFVRDEDEMIWRYKNEAIGVDL